MKFRQNETKNKRYIPCKIDTEHIQRVKSLCFFFFFFFIFGLTDLDTRPQNVTSMNRPSDQPTERTNERVSIEIEKIGGSNDKNRKCLAKIGIPLRLKGRSKEE